MPLIRHRQPQVRQAAFWSGQSLYGSLHGGRLGVNRKEPHGILIMPSDRPLRRLACLMMVELTIGLGAAGAAAPLGRLILFD
jgi:hypothetical protein